MEILLLNSLLRRTPFFSGEFCARVGRFWLKPLLAELSALHNIKFLVFPTALVFVFFTNSFEANAEIKTPPNVLLIIVDDFGARDMGCYGSTLYETPRIDQFATSGALFTQAYSSYPRCVPSRFALLTGKHPARFQGNNDGLKIVPGRDITIGKMMSGAGYRTFYCGKWHLGEGSSSPSQSGFQESFAAGEAGATHSHFAPYNVSAKGKKKGEEESPIPDIDEAPEGEYLTDRLTQKTCDWIRANQKGPFFAVLAHYAVHTPIQGKTNFIAKYQTKLRSQPSAQNQFEKESAGENLLVQNNPRYAAMVESVDESVGTILGLLDSLGLTEKTVVILTSDHGGLSARGNTREVATSNRPLRAGKGHLYEGGIRVPLMVRVPGKTSPGSRIDIPVVGTDLFPSLAQLTGSIPPEGTQLDGKSWLPLLDKSTSDNENPRKFVWHNPAPRPKSTGDLFSSALRDGNLKLIIFPEENKRELYNLSTDPGESDDLSAERPEDVARMDSELHESLTKLGAAMTPKIKKNQKEVKGQD